MTRLLVLLTLLLTTVSARGDFDFVALGDTAYNGERDYAVYRQLIERINAADPAFTIHLGDIWGAGNCHDAHIERIAGFFDRFSGPLVYTPGDNEWIDCRHPVMGGYDPAERLDALRARFFPGPRSLGQAPMDLVRQADVSEAHARFVENARWAREGVLFVTVNIPGSNNNLTAPYPDAFAEFAARDAANQAWLNDSARIAREGDYKALVLAMHGNTFESDTSALGAFGPTLRTLRIISETFPRPILVLQGDFHRFVIDRPLREGVTEEQDGRYSNITRLQVYGAPEIRAVRVSVEPDTPWVFGFTPLYGD